MKMRKQKMNIWVVLAAVLSVIGYNGAVEFEGTCSPPNPTPKEPTRDYYVGAVVSHKKLSNKDMDAEGNLLLNLKEYAAKVAIAKQDGADIVVFPESGLLPFDMMPDLRRRTIVPYLQEIPNPQRVSWVPCDEPRGNGTALRHLSCTAQNHQIYVVATLGEIQWCSGATDQYCPPDGRYQYNTIVIFDRMGKLIIRYRKTHLYGERHFQHPRQIDHAVFESDFGVKFATFICFDMTFRDPAVEVIERYGATDILYPTEWLIEEQPFHLSTQLAESFAARHRVNVLFSGLYDPNGGSLGSGIISGKQGILNFTHSAIESAGKVVTAKIPIHRPSPDHLVRNENMSEYESVQLLAANTPSGNTRLCQGGFCCYAKLDITIPSPEYQYRLFVRYGNRTLHRSTQRTWGVANCVVMQCKGSTWESCGRRPIASGAGGYFSLNLTATGSVDGPKPYYHPSMVFADYKVVPKFYWYFGQGRTNAPQGTPGVNVETGTMVTKMRVPAEEPLYIAGLHGRVFEWDNHRLHVVY